MKKALVTGSEGFVGQHLKTELERQDYLVVTYNLRHGNDIRDKEKLRNFLDIERPDFIFHLAAQAYVPESFADPIRTFEVNVFGTLHLLDAVRQLGLKPKIHIAGSSEEYGPAAPNVHGDTQPSSPYAVSKLAADKLAQIYSEVYGMDIVVTRAFNHTGPGRGEMYAESSFAKQIAEIEKGKRKFLEHGNLDSIRNYTDVRDVVKAYILAVNATPGVYNICSETNISIGVMLNKLADLSHEEISHNSVHSADRDRPNDFDFLKPRCDAFRAETGWRPEIPFEQTLSDLLDYWRKRV